MRAKINGRVFWAVVGVFFAQAGDLGQLRRVDARQIVEGQEAIPRAGANYVPALADPALRPRDADISPDAYVHEQFAAQVKTDIGRWGKVIREAGIKAD